MTLTIRILLILTSFLSFSMIMYKIRKSRVLIHDSIFWILSSALLLGISLFPQVVFYISDLLGFISSINLVFLLIIFVLAVKVFYMSVSQSQADTQIKQLAQKIALLEKELKDQKKQ